MRAIVIDREASARSQLLEWCEQAGVQVLAQADSGASGVEAIRVHGPDLVLLEAELKDMSGCDVLRTSKSYCQDVMAIMITAQHQHARGGLQCSGVVDFLSKPVAQDQFISAIAHARRELGHTRHQRRGTAHAAGANETFEVCLIGEKAQRLHFLDATAIDYIESNGNYLSICSGADRYISRNTLKHVTAMLAPLGFMRIERSLLINLRKVAFVERLQHGNEVAFVLRTGGRLTCGKTYRTEILRELRRGYLTLFQT